MNNDRGYAEGYASCWAFRWSAGCRVGHYQVTVLIPCFKAEVIDAVVDDFGNLVPVN